MKVPMAAAGMQNGTHARRARNCDAIAARESNSCGRTRGWRKREGWSRKGCRCAISPAARPDRRPAALLQGQKRRNGKNPLLLFVLFLLLIVLLRRSPHAPSCTGGQKKPLLVAFTFSEGTSAVNSPFGYTAARKESASAAHQRKTADKLDMLSAAQLHDLHQERGAHAALRAPSGTCAARLAVGRLADCYCWGHLMGAAFGRTLGARARYCLACLITCRCRRRRLRRSRARGVQRALSLCVVRVCRLMYA